MLAIGVRVRSLTTRGKNVGIVGKVLWIGPGQFKRRGEAEPTMRVEVETESGEQRYLDLDKVEEL